MTERPGWRLITGTGSAAEHLEVLDPLPFQTACVDGFVASQVARGFSQLTIDTVRLPRISGHLTG
jgi:integrase/recombinase XerD